MSEKWTIVNFLATVVYYFIHSLWMVCFRRICVLVCLRFLHYFSSFRYLRCDRKRVHASSNERIPALWNTFIAPSVRKWKSTKTKTNGRCILFSTSNRFEFTHKKLFRFTPNAVVHIKLINKFIFTRSENVFYFSLIEFFFLFTQHERHQKVDTASSLHTAHYSRLAPIHTHAEPIQFRRH